MDLDFIYSLVNVFILIGKYLPENVDKAMIDVHTITFIIMEETKHLEIEKLLLNMMKN